MSIPKTIALSGATGNLGPALLHAMLEANYSVLVLSRNATPALSPHANLKVAQTDYDVPSLVSILKAHSVDTVVCALSSTPTTALIQTALIEATLEAGVSRYVPTYWGSDVGNAKTATLPFFAAKVATGEQLRSLAQQGRLSYVGIACGPFLDWCIQANFCLSAKEKKVTWHDTGDEEFSTTTLASLGKALVGVLQHWSDVADSTVKVHDAIVTQRELLSYAKEVVGADGWTETHTDSAEAERVARTKFADGSAGVHEVYALIGRSIWGEGYGGRFDHVDNAKVGLPVMSKAEIKKAVQGFC